MTPDSFLTFWKELNALGIPVLAIRDTPRPPADVAECLALNGVDTRECDFPRPQDVERLAADSPDRLPDNVTVVDLSDWFCTSEVCPAVVGDVIVYYDGSHITRSYSRLLAPVLAQVAPMLE